MSCKECSQVSLFSRPVRRAAMIALCLLAPAYAAAHAESVRAWPTAVVVDDDIRVADVCMLQGFDAEAHERVTAIVVAPAPKPGGSSLVHLDDIRSALVRNGVNLATVIVKGASRCAVTRPGVAVRPASPGGADRVPEQASDDRNAPGRTLRQAVRDFFREQVERAGGTLNLTFGRTAKPVLDLSEPEFEFVVRRRSGRTLGMVSLEVVVRRQGKTVQVVPMVVTASFTKPVVVAQRSINAKATVSPQDVQVVDMTFTQFNQAGLSDPARAIGQRARRFIAAGETIHLRQLEPVPLVHRGQIVDVHAMVGGVRVVTSAKAMQSGAYGDVIELRSHDGKRRTISAVVTGPRRVEVRPAGAKDRDGGILLAGAAE
ncbi:MAG: flagellar basal body P-ring formation protein FlgA [Phycisphaerales bacterium]|nr:MAG: flagellar basal body P-ring formation protein FlgA [Phycisphaerales bacterium]